MNWGPNHICRSSTTRQKKSIGKRENCGFEKKSRKSFRRGRGFPKQGSKARRFFKGLQLLGECFLMGTWGKGPLANTSPSLPAPGKSKKRCLADEVVPSVGDGQQLHGCGGKGLEGKGGKFRWAVIARQRADIWHSCEKKTRSLRGGEGAGKNEIARGGAGGPRSLMERRNPTFRPASGHEKAPVCLKAFLDGEKRGDFCALTVLDIMEETGRGERLGRKGRAGIEKTANGAYYHWGER